MSMDVDDLVRRLRGEYRIPITDCLGAAGGDEPNNTAEFVRHFPTPEIQKEAATQIEILIRRIAALVAERDVLRGALKPFAQMNMNPTVTVQDANIVKIVDSVTKEHLGNVIVGNFRRAAEVLADTGNGEEPAHTTDGQIE